MKCLPVFVVLLVLLASCGESESDPVAMLQPSETSQQTAAPTGTSDPPSGPAAAPDLVNSYFELVADTSYTATSGTAEPGSLADSYGFYLTEVSKFSSPAATRITLSTDDMVVLQGTDSTGTREITYTDIVVGPSGVSSFSIDGNPLSVLLTRGSSVAVNTHGVTAINSLMYRSVGGSRIAVVGIENASASIWQSGYQASFVADDGSQDDALEVHGTNDIRPGATGQLVLIFDSEPTITEGTLYISGTVNDFADDSELVVQLG